MKRFFNRMNLRFIPFLLDIGRAPEFDWYNIDFIMFRCRSLVGIQIKIWRDEDPGSFISVDFLFFRIVVSPLKVV